MRRQAVAKTATTTPDEDTDKRARFVEEYLVDFNGTQAAIRAGYSPRSAHVTASRLLTDAKVIAQLGAGRSRLRRRVEATQENVVEQLRRLGFSDIRNVVRWGSGVYDVEDEADEELEGQPHGGALKRRRIAGPALEIVGSDEIDEETAAAISEISQGPHGVKIKLHDKMPALDRLGKHLGMFKDEIQINGPVSFVIENAPDQRRKA